MYYYRPRNTEKEFVSTNITINYVDDYYKITANDNIKKGTIVMKEKSDFNLFGYIKNNNVFDMLYIILKNKDNNNIKNLYPRNKINIINKKDNPYIFDLRKEIRKYKDDKIKNFLLNIDDDILYLHYYKYLFNAFQIYDSSILLFKGARMNHSENPNIKFYSQNDCMYFETIKDIKKGEELTYSYLRNVKLISKEEITQYLINHYNFIQN